MFDIQATTAPDLEKPTQDIPPVNPDQAENARAPKPDSTGDWLPPPKTHHEDERLALLRALNILDTARDDSRFSDITKLMRSAFDVRIAAVSLVDSDEYCIFSLNSLSLVLNICYISHLLSILSWISLHFYFLLLCVSVETRIYAKGRNNLVFLSKRILGLLLLTWLLLARLMSFLYGRVLD